MLKSIHDYIQTIFHAVNTVLKGMWITLKNMFKTPITIQYPDVDIMQADISVFGYRGCLSSLPDRYRGFLNVDLEICIGCDLCLKACPIDCIKIESIKIDKISIMGKGGKKVNKIKHPVRFDIHLGKCMYCGLCVEPCPTGAIFFTKEFEGATYSLNTLIARFAKKEASKIQAV